VRRIRRWNLIMARPPVTAVPILIYLAACAHDSGGARPATESPAISAAPAAAKSAPEVQQQAPTPSAAADSGPATATGANQGGTATATPAAPAPQGQSGSTAARARPSNQATSSHSQSPQPLPAASTAAAAASQPPQARAATAPSLDLNGLEQRLRETRALGLFTKLSLKNQVDDLLAQFRAFHQGQSRSTLSQLRQQYELLLMKVVSLLQNGDPALASAVLSSREAIWGVLTDPKKFAAI
jgi:hypothetical protein